MLICMVLYVIVVEILYIIIFGFYKKCVHYKRCSQYFIYKKTKLGYEVCQCLSFKQKMKNIYICLTKQGRKKTKIAHDFFKDLHEMIDYLITVAEKEKGFKQYVVFTHDTILNQVKKHKEIQITDLDVYKKATPHIIAQIGLCNFDNKKIEIKGKCLKISP